MEGLFDIGKENFEALLRADKEIPRTQAAIEEDLLFYYDQQTERKWFMSRLDTELATTVEKRLERYKRQERMREKYLEEQKETLRCESAPPPITEEEDSIVASDESLTPTKKR